jgi:ribulose-5-phosphate 4-epimerase/fuculose-1-phosphate aldolase
MSYEQPEGWPRALKGLSRSVPTPMTVQQELACALRILAHDGWQENVSGHITWARDDASEQGPGGLSSGMLCNPWGIWWDETCASDIMRVTADGEVLEGPWDVTGAVYIHTELHRVRPDARVVVHGHPYYATLLGNLGVAPEISHQNSCIFDGEIAFVDEYDGAVDNADAGVRLATQIGKASGIVLANHGAIVTGDSIAEACYKAVTFERMCRFTFDALCAQRPLQPVAPAMRSLLQEQLRLGCPDVFWHGAVRRLVRAEPDVLD